MSQSLIKNFYLSFKEGNYEKMSALYHPEATFHDPVFETLSYKETIAMWKMLIERSKGNLTIDFHSIEEKNASASCIWEAKYEFSKSKRTVHNIIHSTMHFKAGKIIQHQDQFSLWRWASMALGLSGKLLGWTPFFQQKIRQSAQSSLEHYQNKSPT